MERCPGDPNGHEWVLHKESNETFWVYPTYRSLFKKRIIRRDGALEGGFPSVFAYIETWYCSRCRKWDTVREEVRDFDYWLDRGYAIYDWREKEYLMPTLTKDEANELRDS